MRIIVLGMHRSGTSVVSNLLSLMGCYFASGEVSIGASEQNPDGFFERRDVRNLNDDLLRAIGCDWDRVADFSVYRFWEIDLEPFLARGREIVAELEAHGSWFLKEPRMCLTLPFWRTLFGEATCLYVHRHPAEVGLSLHVRNGFPLPYGLALWEKYNLQALQVSRGMPLVSLAYETLLTDPVAEVRRVHAELDRIHPGGVRALSESEILSVVKPQLYRHQAASGSAGEVVNRAQAALYDALVSGAAFTEEIPALSAMASDIIRGVETLRLAQRPATPEVPEPEPIHPEVERLGEVGQSLVALAKDYQRAYEDLAHDYRKATSAGALAFALIPWMHIKRRLDPKRRRGVEALDARRRALATALRKSRNVAVVICIHNALEDVRLCLEALLLKAEDCFLVLVDDGSDEPTRKYVKEFSKRHPACQVIRHNQPRGYTIAANAGLRVTTQPYVVLLNSDTIIGEGWLNRIVSFGEAHPEAGIFGPVSNAASYQSVPERYGPKGAWAINALPEGVTVDDMTRLVELSAPGGHPHVGLLNGFCFVIRREVIDAIGYLDEETFPQGYGEENDYCLRATAAGFQLAVVTDLYVYHAKSKSFGSERRAALSKEAHQKLLAKHGEETVEKAKGTLENEPLLAKLREALAKRIPEAGGKLLKVLFLMPMKAAPNGGIYSVIQEAAGLRELGVYAQVGISDTQRRAFTTMFPEYPDSLFLSFRRKSDLERCATSFDVVVATIFTGMRMLERIAAANPAVLPAYYVQDYEPLFFEPGSDFHREAVASYTALPQALLFAKTQWLCDIVREKHGRTVEKVSASVDHNVYHNRGCTRTPGVVTICAMVRPETPRRGSGITMEVLAKIKGRFGPAVRIVTFGCRSDDSGLCKLRINFEFENFGQLPREKVAELLRRSDLFVDFSTYQAFGRTALEAMACGCAVMVPKAGGTDEYAIDHQNALIVDTTNEGAMVAGLTELISDPALRETLVQNGLAKAREYTVEKAAVSESRVMRAAVERHRNR